MKTLRCWWRSTLRGSLLCLILLAELTACKARGLPTIRAITGPDQIVRALEAAGAVVNPAPGKSLIAPLPGTMYQVNGEQVQIGPAPESAPQMEADTGELYWAGPGWYVTYAGRDGGLILLLSGLLGDPLQATPASVEEPFPPAIPLAMRALAAAEGRTPQEVVVLSYQPVAWTDACLGLGQLGEACAQAETPGWLIRVALDEKTYDLRSDQAGMIVRWNETDPTPQSEEP